MQKQIIIGTLILIILLFTQTKTTLAQTQAQQNTAPFSDLNLEVSTPKYELTKLEPIIIKFEISNRTDKNIIGHWAVDFSFPYINLSIHHKKEKYDVTTLLPKEGLKIFVPTIIRPGEIHELIQTIDFSLEEMFPESGDYQLEFTLQNTDNNEQIKSNLLTIKVNQPQERELEALNFMQNHGTIHNYFDAKRMIINEQAVDTAEDFLSKFGDTNYGNYVALKVSEFYLFVGKNRGTIDPETGIIRVTNPSPSHAIKYLEKLSTKEDFALADQTLHYLAIAYRDKGEKDKEQSTIELLKRKYPTSQYVNKKQ